MTLSVRAHHNLLSAVVLLSFLSMCDASSGQDATTPAEVAEPSGTKRALIIAIARYAPDTGWRTIHSDRDVPLIQTVLKAHQFSDIQVLPDSEATRQGIVDAVRRIQADPGDVVVIHVSAHGQQITDNNGDEIDGYDESIVPYDAPAELKLGYDGSKHLRDDTFDELMQELRNRVGPTGHVVAFIDSCFSGTPRGDAPGSASIRGGSPLGPPQAGHRGGVEDGSGFVEGARGGSTSPAMGGLAPYVVFSASRHDQFAWETKDENGDPVGSLSYALSLELAKPSPNLTKYIDLYQAVKLQIAYRTRNEPQVEGDVKGEIFNGRLEKQDSFLTIQKIVAPNRVEVGAGRLVGFLPGSRAELHPNGTAEPTDPTLLARAEVVDSGLTTAVLELDRTLSDEVLHSSRVFITEHSFGTLRIPVRLECLAKDVRIKLENTLRKVASVELVKDNAQVVIRQQREAPYALEVRVAADEYPLLLGLLPTERDFTNQIGDRLIDYARNRYLRGLKIEDGALDVRLEMVPVKVEGCDPEIEPHACIITPLDPALKRTSGGQMEWRSEDFFQLLVENKSTMDIHLTILALGADGTLEQLWPDTPGDKTTLAAQAPPTKLLRFYQLPVYDRWSSEMFLLIATKDFFDFEPFVTRGEPKGPLGPFAPLFDEEAVRSGIRTFYSEKLVGTSAVTFTACPPEGTPCLPFGKRSDQED